MSVFEVTLIKKEHGHFHTHRRAVLTIPAPRALVMDAFHKIRTDGRAGDYTISVEDAEIKIDIPENSDIWELNFLAHRISEIEDSYGLVLFQAYIKLQKEPSDLKKLINMTYHIADVLYVPVVDDKELGEFYAENGFVDGIDELPDEIYEYLDFSKIGIKVRIEEKGIFINGGYVVDNNDEDFQEIYDGTTLPEHGEDYVFKLFVTAHPASSNSHDGEWITLPATDEHAQYVADAVGEQDIHDCVFDSFNSVIPPVTKEVFGDMNNFSDLNALAYSYQKLSVEEQIKFKAVLQFNNCEDIKAAVHTLDNLDAYSINRNINSPFEYGILYMKENLGIGVHHHNKINFSAVGEALMERNERIQFTDYGLVEQIGGIILNDKELETEEQNQDMGGMNL